MSFTSKYTIEVIILESGGGGEIYIIYMSHIIIEMIFSNLWPYKGSN